MRLAPRKLAATVGLTALLNPIAAMAFGQPAGLDDLRSKPQNYGRLADVGVKEFLVKDGKQLLREATPIGSKMQFSLANTGSNAIKKVTDELELIRLRLEQVGTTNKPVWNSVGVEYANLMNDITANKDNKALTGGSGSASKMFEERVNKRLPELGDAIKRNDAEATLQVQEEVAAAFNDIQQAALPKKKLPYAIPSEYDNLPRLLGRATVDFTFESKANKGKGFKYVDPGTPTGTGYSNNLVFRVVVDGYTHPLTGGNFVDNVIRKKYDNVPVKAEELIVQTQTPGNKEGRAVPLELFYKVDEEPTYSITSDDEGRALDTQKLPFQAYGTIGMARNEDVDSATEDFFILKWKQALAPPGRNTLDGYYSSVGYVVSDNVDLLSQVLDKGDKIVSAKVVSGAENLVVPK
jgi:cyclophilin family peptidyl-prolyl cis-trans isomerase